METRNLKLKENKSQGDSAHQLYLGITALFCGHDFIFKEIETLEG